MAIPTLQIPTMGAVSGGVDWTPLAQLGDVYRKAQQDQLRRDTLASLGQGGANGQIDVKPLLASGDLSLAQLGIGIMNNQTAQARDARDFAYRQQESQRAQANSDRSFGLQKENAEKPQYRTIKDASGNDQIISIDSSGTPTTVAVPGQGGSGVNPYSYGGKMNESQSKDAGYANRLFRAEGVLRDPAIQSAGQSVTQRGLANLPGAGSYYSLNSPDYQKYDQAGRDFINAVLRRESGAAISQSEFDNAYRQYLPRPGDTPDVLAQKQKNRQDAIAGIAGGGGPNYRPPFTFDESGALVRTQEPGQGVTPRQGSSQQASAPAAAINALKANPKLRAQFDAKYGNGSAAQYLD